MLRRSAILSLVLTAFFAFGDTASAFHDSLKGERDFKRCASCHSLKAGVHKSGPSLKDVIGRRAGTAEGFHYSKDLKAAGAKGLVWDHQTVHDYIGNPKGFLSAYLGKRRARTKMKLRYPDHEFRDAVITHLEHNGKKR